MPTQKLAHHLRACRKRSGLSQREVAYLLGADTRTQLSLFERRRQPPTLRAAFAFEALYGAPLAEMFAGIHDTAGRELRRRARRLVFQLQSADKRRSRITAQKLQWLAEHCTEPDCKLTHDQ